MPFIDVKLSVPLSKEKEISLKEKLGNAVSVIGKSEGTLMIAFLDNLSIYFRGNNSEPMAFVNVMLLGSAGKAAYQNFTEKVCEILSDELKIVHTYVKYEEVTHWGYNGNNF